MYCLNFSLMSTYSQSHLFKVHSRLKVFYLQLRAGFHTWKGNLIDIFFSHPHPKKFHLPSWICIAVLIAFPVVLQVLFSLGFPFLPKNSTFATKCFLLWFISSSKIDVWEELKNWRYYPTGIWYYSIDRGFSHLHISLTCIATHTHSW